MNKGAITLNSQFFSPEQVEEIATIARADEASKFSVHEQGRYADIQWHQVNLEHRDFAWLNQIYSTLGITTAELAVFYYLSPTAHLHPHRDLTGASMNNRLRFHIPIITSDKVDFQVSHERIRMLPGQLWCLDTSYLHSVYNGGDHTRVHIVIECQVTDAIRAMLPPRTMRDRMHDLYFFGLMAVKLIKALAINSFTNPAYFKAQLGMVRKFIRWRILKLDKAK